MKILFRSAVIAIFLMNPLSASENILSSKKYQSNTESSIMSFILLNHSRLVHEIELGRGDYVESLITQKQNSKIDFTVLRMIANGNQDTYAFAKAVVEYN